MMRDRGVFYIFYNLFYPPSLLLHLIFGAFNISNLARMKDREHF